MARRRASDEAESILLRGAKLLGAPRETGDVLVAGRRIVAIGGDASRRGRAASVRKIDLDGRWLAPGFVDLHTHGAVGVDFVEADEEAFARSIDHYLEHGVTSLLVSLYPTDWKRSLEVTRRVAGYIERGVGRGVAVGIHLEGPFLNPGRPGALPPRSFRGPSTRDADALLEAGGGHVRTVTIAPELRGGIELVRHLIRRGVVPAFGHSLAGYDETCAALDAGVRYATHLFNAMTGLHHREPGAVTALLEHPDVAVELIADGHHVAPAVLALVHREKRADRVILVSDSAHPCGLRDGRYRFAGADIELRDGRITQLDGTLAGSALTLDRALAIEVREAGVGVADAIRCVTANPAAAIGHGRRHGRIAVGRRADLVAIGEDLRVEATWLAGELVWRRPRSSIR